MSVEPQQSRISPYSELYHCFHDRPCIMVEQDTRALEHGYIGNGKQIIEKVDNSVSGLEIVFSLFICI